MEGYVGEAPIIHQAVALKAAIDAMDTAFAEDRGAIFWRGSGRMIRPSGSWCIGRCGATKCAIRACAPTLRTRKAIGCDHCPLDRLDSAA